jgi:capsid assembly protease
MSKFSHLSSLVFNKPLMVTQDYAETIAVVLSDRLNLDAEGLQIKSDAKDQRVVTTSKGVAVIPIVGSMSHRATGIEAMSGMTSYTTLQKQFEAAFNDPNVGSILMDIDSPGGSVAGAFDFRDYLVSKKGTKPVYALARDAMCSAAYLIGSTADKVYATQTARVGSIGVVAMHTDASGKMEKEGLKPTFISAGKFKTAGNPYEKLEGDKLKYLQDSVDESYDMFINAVADARGIDKKVIRDTEARVYGGKKAVEIGLADGIRTYESVIAEMSAPNFTTQGIRMENKLNIEEAKIADLTVANTKLQSDNEALRKQVLDAGFKITSEGLIAKEAPEMIYVGGEQIDASTLPKSVVDALKEKADTELTSLATSEYPNLKASVAKKLYATFGEDEEMKEAIAAFNTKMGSFLEEKGDTDPGVEQKTAQEKYDAAVKANMEATGADKITAYANVANTEEGKKLIQAIYKEKE